MSSVIADYFTAVSGHRGGHTVWFGFCGFVCSRGFKNRLSDRHGHKVLARLPVSVLKGLALTRYW